MKPKSFTLAFKR
jgi:hypothetical protein